MRLQLLMSLTVANVNESEPHRDSVIAVKFLPAEKAFGTDMTAVMWKQLIFVIRIHVVLQTATLPEDSGFNGSRSSIK